MKKYFLFVFCLLACVSVADAKMQKFEKSKTGPCDEDKELLCYFGDSPVTGILEEHDKDGVLLSETEYVYGKKDGVEKIYYKPELPHFEPQLKSQAKYQQDKKIYSRHYHKNGGIRMTEDYTKDQTEVRFYLEDGELEQVTAYNPATKDGAKTLYNKNGTIRAVIPLKNGEEEGFVQYRYESGELEEEVTYKAGKIDGVRKLYDVGGLFAEQNYKNDMKNGISKKYVAGVLLNEINYLNDKKDGLAKGYDDKGNVLVEITYKDDKPVSGYSFDKTGKKSIISTDELDNFRTGIEPFSLRKYKTKK